MRLTKKRAGVIAIASVAALVLGACGSSGSGTTSSGSDAGSQNAASSEQTTESGESTGSASDAGGSADADGGSDANEGDSSESTDPVTLDFRVNFASDSPQLAKLKEVTKNYEGENPNVTVKIVGEAANYE